MVHRLYDKALLTFQPHGLSQLSLMFFIPAILHQDFSPVGFFMCRALYLKCCLSLLTFFLNFLFIFKWRIISLQYCVGFCHTSHESAIGRHMSIPSWTSLLPPTPFHPSRLSQSPGFSSLSQTANFHWLSILHMVVYVSMLPSHLLHPHPSSFFLFYLFGCAWC